MQKPVRSRTLALQGRSSLGLIKMILTSIASIASATVLASSSFKAAKSSLHTFLTQPVGPSYAVKPVLHPSRASRTIGHGTTT